MKIAAVVVTFNRLNLLKECINAIRNQTRKVDEIFVVNNNSTDGTLEWLSQQNDLTVITQENSGSAGGQYTGIKAAYEKGYDWIWCMDDDCLPTINCLEKQIPDDANVLTGPFVIYDNKPVWNYNYNKLKYFILKLLNIPYMTIPFNGFLISKTIVRKIGLPKKELFIYCDDVEYSYRAIKNNFKLEIKKDAYLNHPLPKNPLIYNDLQLFYYIRNNIYVARKYDFLGFRLLLKILHTMNILIKKRDKIIFKAIKAGLNLK